MVNLENCSRRGKIVTGHSKGTRLYLAPALAIKLGRKVLLLPYPATWYGNNATAGYRLYAIDIISSSVIRTAILRGTKLYSTTQKIDLWNLT